MINKVNRPAFLSLVSSTKQAENHPGSSQGSGLSYDGSPGQADQEQRNDAQAIGTPTETESSTPGLKLVPPEKMGMSDVVKEFYATKKDRSSSAASQAGLSLKYSSASGTAKGLLLNKKVE